MNSNYKLNCVNMWQIRLFVVLTSLLIILFGCERTNQYKHEFIQKNIATVNAKNVNKYGELIIPEFLLKEDVATLGQSNLDNN